MVCGHSSLNLMQFLAFGGEDPMFVWEVEDFLVNCFVLLNLFWVVVVKEILGISTFLPPQVRK